jgi:hypothetical protein
MGIDVSPYARNPHMPRIIFIIAATVMFPVAAHCERVRQQQDNVPIQILLDRGYEIKAVVRAEGEKEPKYFYIYLQKGKSAFVCAHSISSKAIDAACDKMN